MRSRSFAKRVRICFAESAAARCDLRSFQEKRQPLFPCAVCPHSLKQVVVPVTVRFEVQAEVQERLSQRTLGAKQERDQQPTESAVAVEKGVNRLKLHVNQSCLNQ